MYCNLLATCYKNLRKMNYIELECTIENDIELVSDILSSLLGEIGYDSFVDTESGLLAYIPENIFDINNLNSIEIPINNVNVNITYKTQRIETKNWNAEWEQSYEPIIVEEQCIVRAPFHAIENKYKYDIVISPKMSFGTGHHETTFLILKEILTLDLENKTVLDMGCGTGILAILASMRGAKQVTAIDNDDWVIDNVLENIEINKTSNVSVLIGDFNIEFPLIYDVIFANINKNALLQGLANLSKVIKKDGLLILSGLYIADKEAMLKEAAKQGFAFVSDSVKGKWIALKFIKN